MSQSKLWTHGDLRVNAGLSPRVSQGAYAAPKIGYAVRNGSAESTLNLSPVSFFILSTFIIIPFILAAIVFNSDHAPSIFGNSHTQNRYAFSGFASKEEFLKSLSAPRRQELASQVNFIADHIDALRNQVDPEIAKHIVFESARQSYNPLFVASVVHSESTFKSGAVSPVGAVGLMQIMPDTGKHISKIRGQEWHGQSKLKDPRYNIELGITYLKYLEGVFNGNKKFALIAYNWGPNNLKLALAGKLRIPGSCIEYANQVLARYRRWDNEFNTRLAASKYLNTDKILS